MSHLKVQKLLFYVQSYHLAYFKTPLFQEEFEAWLHGPVCRNVYDEFKTSSRLYADLSFEDIPQGEDPSTLKDNLSSDQFTLLTDVLNNLSSWTSFELETATHNEEPWIKARIGYAPADRCDAIISKKSMLEYYSKEINDI